MALVQGYVTKTQLAVIPLISKFAIATLAKLMLRQSLSILLYRQNYNRPEDAHVFVGF